MKNNTINISISVPRSLNVSGLTVNHLKFLAILGSIIQVSGDDVNNEYSIESKFQNLNSNYLIKNVGNQYSKIIQELEDLEIIEVNNKYSAGSFSKGYRYNSKFWQDIEDDKWVDDVIIPLKRVNFKKPKIQTTNDDVYLNRLLSYYSDVNVEADWQDEVDRVCLDGIKVTNSKSYYRDLKYVTQVNTGHITTVSVAKSGRIYHPLICMRKELRKHCTFGKEVKYLDVKACHPTVIGFFSNEQAWLDACKTDIYNEINPDKSLYSRDQIKVKFQQVVSYYPKGARMNKVVKAMREMIKNKFPVTWNLFEIWWKDCAVSGLTPQMRLQQLESRIFVGFCKQYNNFAIPMHDGLIIDSNFNINELHSFVESTVPGLKLTLTESI